MPRRQFQFRNRRLITGLLAGVFALACVSRLVTMVAGMVWRDDPDARRDAARAAADAAGPAPRPQRVVIVSVDGLRPDVLLRARAPRIRSLMERGAFTMWARTTEVSVTLPSHTSMLTGVRPDLHGVLWNYTIDDAYPEVPTIFERAHLARDADGRRLTTCLVAGKRKFVALARPGAVDFERIFQDGEADNAAVGRAAADLIRAHAPRVTFVHFHQVDGEGHGSGWGTPEQLDAVATADRGVGLVLDALDDRGLTASTLVILSADHGGQGWGHGPNDPRSRHIPWIAAGPGVRQNFDLTQYGGLVVNTEDTFVTACTLMDIPLPANVDGKYVGQILRQDDLLVPAGSSAADATDDEADGGPAWERTPIPSHHE